jgi:hypothetical protein
MVEKFRILLLQAIRLKILFVCSLKSDKAGCLVSSLVPVGGDGIIFSGS